MTTRTLSLQLEEDFTTHTAALFVSHANVFQSTIRIIAGERSTMRKVFSGSSPWAFVRDSRYRSLQTALTKPKL